MNYEIYDHWASIKFVVDGSEFLLPKAAIKKISIVGDDTVRISTGSCLGGIAILALDVIYPEAVSADGLVNYLNTLITLSLIPPIGGG